MAEPASAAAPTAAAPTAAASVVASAAAPTAAAPATPGLLRRALPWLIGLGILVVLGMRLPFDAFRDAVGQGPHLLLAAVNLAIMVAVLCTDSLSSWVALRAVRIRRPLLHIAAVRGATYLLIVINYAVGQGAFGYYLHRTGAPTLRAVGSTLFLIGTSLATLLLITTVAWATHAADPGHQAMWFTLVGGCAALAVYLLVIAVAPRFLTRLQLFAPLFEAGLRGHTAAILARLPHLMVVVLGHWLALVAWGIPVPFSAGLMYAPAVVFASVLPFAPGGLGTTQAAFVFFFSDLAVGATAEARSAAVLAFAITHFVYGVVALAAVGLACTPLARRIDGAMAPRKGR